MKARIAALTVLSALAVTGAAAQGVDLSGQYRCVQNCRGTGPVSVTQSGRDLRLVDESGVPSAAWIDWPGHIWSKSWNEGAIFPPDGVTIQFDRGTVWQRDLGARPYIVVPRRPDTVVAAPPPPSVYEIYQSLRRPYLCHLPSEPCDNTQRVQN
jgi:hypothetical protein